MEREIRLPELAESVVEAEVVEWLVAEGDTITLDQPLLEVASDKVTVELPSPYAGVLVKRLCEVGETIAVGSVIARITEAESADQPADDNGASAAPEEAPEEAEPDASEDDADEGDSLSLFKPSAGDTTDVHNPFLDKALDDEPPTPTSGARAGDVPAVPSARIEARRQGVDIADVTGSGPGGRIRVADVEQHIERGAQTPRGAGDAGAGAPLAYATPAGYAERERRVPLRGTRKAIARQMTDSHLHAVRTLVVEEADMTRLKAMRAALKTKAEERGVRLSYLPFVFKALVAGLQAYPNLNTSLDEANGEIVHKDYYNLGLAVAADSGLAVPVVRDVDQRSLLDTSREINRLSDAVRNGDITIDDMRGSTFSVTNVGSIGALFSFPIINVPDAAILGVHSIRERPIAVDGQVEVRPMMYLSLSFDHRLVDGAEAAQFLQHVIGLLERPDELLLDAV